MKKATRSAIIILLIFLCSTASAYAVDPLALHVEGCKVRDSFIDVHFNTNLSAPPSNNELSLLIGNTPLSIKEIKKISEAKQGTSVIFLVDVSGSISAAKLQNIKDVLNSMADRMSELDNASVLTVGNEAYTQPFVSSKEQLKQQIAAIKGVPENTNLYSSITKALDILSTNEKSNPKKYMVILSDGEDYVVKGITREEVNTKIEKLHIPIYTVAMIGDNPEEEYIKTSKILGSFARLSPGGIDYIHKLNKDSSSKIAADIKSSIDKSLVLTADLTGFKSEGNEMYMKLELSVAGQGKASSGYTIPTNGLSRPAPVKEPDNPPKPVEKPSSTPIWLIIGGSVIIIAVLAIIITKKRKKAVILNEPEPEIASADTDIQQTVDIQEEMSQTIQKAEPGIIMTSDLAIKLTKVGLTENQVFNSEICGELVIGRDPSKSALSFPDDDLLSSRHCVIKYVSGKLFLQDLGSTNGTYVNGITIKDAYKLENDDVILIGSMELRISW